ncbi:hypothetical protein SAMN02787076_03274 [Rhizobacter sp. OV335]|nr:hypothetical protein SAMN02787076_03274 [Rhizobacter sp. OV335]
MAKVLGQTIYRDDTTKPARDLDGQILGPLLQRFAEQERLSVTDAEVAELETALKLPPSPPGLSESDKAMLRQLPREMVLQWKISKALYQRYGGEVIFQQANPMEPVGAMRRFLEEQEKAGAFEIYNAEDRKRFFEYFVRPQIMVVPKERVNYDVPWWRKAN